MDSTRVATHDHQLYVQKIKIATAIALIKMTPPGMAVEDYVASIGEQVLQHSDVWVMKSPDLEKLIHSLEQSFCIESQHSTEIPDSIPDLWPPSQNRCCDLVPCAFSQPDMSDIIIPSNNFVTFMNSLLYLKGVASSNQPYADEPEVLHSVSEALGKLFRHLRLDSGLKIPITLAEKAIKTMHDLFHIKEAALTDLLTDTCFFFVDTLICDITSTIEINMFEKQHRFSSLIQIIAQHPVLTSTVVSKLMQEILRFYKSLEDKNTIDVYKLHPVVAMENMFFIFQTIEGIIYGMFKSRNGDTRTLQLPQEISEAWQQMIERITEKADINLPMFCTYLFRVHPVVMSTLKL